MGAALAGTGIDSSICSVISKAAYAILTDTGILQVNLVTNQPALNEMKWSKQTMLGSNTLDYSIVCRRSESWQQKWLAPSSH